MYDKLLSHSYGVTMKTFLVYICKASSLRCQNTCLFYVDFDSKTYLHIKFIVLLCYQYIVFSHITSNSCLNISILYLVLMKTRWFYQTIFIASKLHFGIPFNNTDTQWSLFNGLKFSCRHVRQHGLFHLTVPSVNYFPQILSNIQC